MLADLDNPFKTLKQILDKKWLEIITVTMFAISLTCNLN